MKRPDNTVYLRSREGKGFYDIVSVHLQPDGLLIRWNGDQLPSYGGDEIEDRDEWAISRADFDELLLELLAERFQDTAGSDIARWMTDRGIPVKHSSIFRG